MKNVMIDLETLGTAADAVVMSIGAVEFDLDGRIGRTFYRSISIDSNLDAGRRVQEDTLIWWMKQSEEARKVFEEPKTSLEGALLELSQWYPKDAKAWSNGASFDSPILEHAYCQAHMETPWYFWNTRCVRTYRDLPGADGITKVQAEVAHNALSDAIAQAKHVQAIHQALFGVKEIA